MDGIVGLLRAKRTGTLFIDGWEGDHSRLTVWARHAPIHVCLEDVKTFEEEYEVLDDNRNSMTDEGTLALGTLISNSEGVLKKAWMPRCERPQD